MVKKLVLLFLALAVFLLAEQTVETPDTFVNPDFSDLKKDIVFFSNFQDQSKTTPQEYGWIVSKHPKYSSQNWVIQKAQGKVVGFPNVNYLSTTKEAQHYGISVPVTVTETDNKELVIQYEVKFESSLECGGAYIKILKDLETEGTFDLNEFSNETPYVMMFGPDRCGETNKVHFILRHFNPKSKVWEEKHLQGPPVIKNDGLTHLYTLILRKDNTFEILIDLEQVKKGNLLDSAAFSPSVIPPKTIDDPTDKKPEDWVDTEMIPDPNAKKPDDWNEDEPETIEDPDDIKPDGWLDDEPFKIPDPSAKKPEDWDDEEDGKWEAPLVDNPKCKIIGCGEWKPRKIKNPSYKGKWTPQLINNPEYIGPWKPKQIPNPNYFEDLDPAAPILSMIKAIGIEIWTMQKNIQFNNFLVATSGESAKTIAEKTWSTNFQKMKKEQEVLTPKAETSKVADFYSKLREWLGENVEGYVKTAHTLLWAVNLKLGKSAIPVLVSVAVVLLTIAFLMLRFCLGLCFTSETKKSFGKKKKTNKKDSDSEGETESDSEGEKEEEVKEEKKAKEEKKVKENEKKQDKKKKK